MRTLLRRHSVRLLRDQRGAAMVEAVAVIPVFIIILGGLAYVASGYAGSLDIRAQGRREAWAHALSGCKGKLSEQTQKKTTTYDALGPLGSVVGKIDNILGFIPKLDRYWPGFVPKERELTRVGVVPRPSGGATQFAHEQRLLCNEVPSNVSISELAVIMAPFLVSWF